MTKRKKEYQQSSAAWLIIVVNLYFYILVHFSSKSQEFINSLILYPSNFLAGKWLTIITTGFVHANISHLFFNMIGVFVFGKIVQHHFGFTKTMFIYFGSLIISMLFSILFYIFIFKENTGIVGASGAIMGLLATAMLLDPFLITYEMILPIPVMFKGWMFLYADLQGLLSPVKDGTCHIAHLLGYISIGILMYFLTKRERKKLRKGLIVNIISFVIFYGIWQFALYFKNLS